MEFVIAFVLGAIFGALLVLLVNHLQKQRARELAQELVNQTQQQKMQELEMLLGRVKDAFGSLSMDALKRNTEEFLKVANEVLGRQTKTGELELEGKKKLIDQTLEGMKADLLRVQTLITEFEKDRAAKFGQLESHLSQAMEQTKRLQETTEQLRRALAGSKQRGQWGERMAEDILRLMGFVEGINYEKQQALDSGQNRPDFTFYLPQERKINMDVKFPLDNYLKYLEAQGENEKENFKRLFLRDVRERIKEVTGRDYIDPGENTLDYVLVFIPNEQVYAFINEHDRGLLDEALQKKVILCSPITLYAVLAIIRQAMENFNLQNTAGQIMKLLESFYKQWQMFVKSLEKMGKKIYEAQQEYESLSTVRKNQLEKPLRQIESLKKQVGPGFMEGEALLIEAEMVEGEVTADGQPGPDENSGAKEK
ncbi:MAG: DNA recombination protein RmuC [Candidatus Saccharicenans subterraneus]|uniref:DNA recombination protein RmuC n=1 Tax=Candidatus Saccharicenans subterraneus TaxID=2508984 RepID=A0A3E2BM55_9BACT|nr:MAG: DNA recombination protein RmuC [Candidatus Saccharicenans subterraneum]